MYDHLGTELLSPQSYFNLQRKKESSKVWSHYPGEGTSQMAKPQVSQEIYLKVPQFYKDNNDVIG